MVLRKPEEKGAAGVIPKSSPLAQVRLLGLLGLRLPPNSQNLHLGEGGTLNQQTNKIPKLGDREGHTQRVIGGSRGPENSTSETYRMKRGLLGRVGCPLQREQWSNSYLGVSEARGAGRGGRAGGPG